MGGRARSRGRRCPDRRGRLARETALTAVAALWRPKAGTTFGRGFRLAGLAVLPLALWLGYVRWRLGPADQGFGNFTWPVTAWIDKWVEVIAAFPRHPDFRWLVTTTLLATVGLTAQAAYVLRRAPDDAWWRLGAMQVLMMALLGTAVWEGHPGAATRVLLPLGIVFAVLAVRDRASWRWLFAGGLVVFAGWRLCATFRRLRLRSARAGSPAEVTVPVSPTAGTDASSSGIQSGRGPAAPRF